MSKQRGNASKEGLGFVAKSKKKNNNKKKKSVPAAHSKMIKFVKEGEQVNEKVKKVVIPSIWITRCSIAACFFPSRPRFYRTLGSEC